MLNALLEAIGSDRKRQLLQLVREYQSRAERAPDLDRLHGVVLDGGGRAAGHTYASCHEIAGTIQVGATAILVMLPSMRWVEHVLPMLQDVLLYHGLGELRRSTMSPRDWMAGDVRIRFGSMQQWDRETAGWHGHAVVIDR